MDPSSPLLLMQLPHVRALDPKSGDLLWETIVSDVHSASSAPGRFFVTTHGLFVLADARVSLLDPATGKITAHIDLPFSPDTAIFDGDCFYVAAVPAAAAVGSDGKLRWKMGVESGVWSGDKLVCRDGKGEMIWEHPAPFAHPQGAAAGIALGGLVAQPDDKGKR